jgi:hypothetical protein
MGPAASFNIPVVDFRRQSMILQWNAISGSWTAYDVPPPLVHGVALIRAAQPNICLFARDGRLHLQVGADQFTLAERSPRLKFSRGLAGLGFRRRFILESSTGGRLLTQAYWTDQGDDFFSWLTARAANPEWRSLSGHQWSQGVEPAVLRSS